MCKDQELTKSQQKSRLDPRTQKTGDPGPGVIKAWKCKVLWLFWSKIYILMCRMWARKLETKSIDKTIEKETVSRIV